MSILPILTPEAAREVFGLQQDLIGLGLTEQQAEVVAGNMALEVAILEREEDQFLTDVGWAYARKIALAKAKTLIQLNGVEEWH